LDLGLEGFSFANESISHSGSYGMKERLNFIEDALFLLESSCDLIHNGVSKAVTLVKRG
jgi:hypothetical protein